MPLAGDSKDKELIVDLLIHPEASIRYTACTRLLGASPDSAESLSLRQEIRAGPRVQTLLSERLPDGTIPYHPYQKWCGAHWIMALLADLDYPAGDDDLVPLREQVLGWLLGAQHAKSIQTIAGRVRRCASQEGNALFALLALGLSDHRCDELARRLATWQWPDGGWNCDRRPEARHSSFMESLIPLRGLNLHARITGSRASAETAERAAEFFLSHSLYQRSRDGEAIAPEFVELHYPCYWHYDILFGLRVMQEMGLDSDPRCQAAKSVLTSQRLPGGGFSADAKYYRVTEQYGSGTSLVDWGPVGRRKRNDFVTVEALAVLSQPFA